MVRTALGCGWFRLGSFTGSGPVLHSSPATVCRIAPEFLVGGRIGSPADVYSMGELVGCAFFFLFFLFGGRGGKGNPALLQPMANLWAVLCLGRASLL